MSLTRILNNSKFKELKGRLKEDFPRPKIQLSGDLIAPPRSKNHGIIGAAFDYLLRFKIEKEFKDKTESESWTADEVIKTLNETTEFKETKLEDVESKYAKNYSKKDIKNALDNLNKFKRERANRRKIFYDNAISLYEEAKSNYNSYMLTGEFSRELAKSSMVLAKLDLFYRAGILDETISTYAKDDIDDLTKLFEIIPIEEFTPRKKVFLNPSFGKGSLLFGGADADVILDNKLIDIKTTQYLEIKRSQLNQLICYSIASRIGGINGNEILKNEIEEVGIYFSRFGKLYLIPLSQFATKEKFKEFEKWMPKYFEKFKVQLTDLF